MASDGFPRRFGSYVLLKPLARGGMGELDLAVTGRPGMEKLCVIKRVLPNLLATENVQRFRDEAMVVVKLSHGNLVGVLDAGREDDQFYLALDFVEGKDLLATWNQCATRRVAFPIEIAAYVIKELARGLAYAHAYRDLQLVHRDISPANVLLSYTGEVRLTDFGLATSKLKEQFTAPGIIYGKLAYLAPEQARGEPLDGRTDLYAAGILLWEMLTGLQLFPKRLPGVANPGTDRAATIDALERVKHPAIAAPSTVTGRVPPDLDAIVLRALSQARADRYQTGEEMRADLAGYLAKHAPETDAATLATFMSLLFQDQLAHERAERDELLREASAMLAGQVFAAAGGPVVDDRKGERRGRTTPPGVTGPAQRSPTPTDGGVGGATNGKVRYSKPDRSKSDREPTGAPAPLAAGPPDATVVSDAMGAAAVGLEAPDKPDGSADALADPAATTGAVPRALARGPAKGADARKARAANGELAVDAGAAAGAVADDDAAADKAAVTDEPSQESDFGYVEEDRRVGSTIAGRYFLRRLCGEGAMGRVYEAHHIEIGRRVAIKILHSTYRHTPDVVERFRREARAASKIGHPNIVDVTDSGTTSDGAFFFVMEYLDGVDLEQLITRDGHLSVERSLMIAAQVCRALTAAHEAGIVHRDLKPANVMLVRHRDEEDFVKVLDFGISKQSDQGTGSRNKSVGLTRPDAAVGTPIYMAPEQVAGLPADARTDVYAVGELLFEMLTGTPPCSGSDVIAVFNKKANEDPPPVRSVRAEVPLQIERMLTQAMSRRPSDRQERMVDLKDEIMRCISGLHAAPAARVMPESRPDLVATGVLPAVVPTRTGSRTIWIAGAGVVAGLGIAALVVSWRIDLSADRALSSPPAPAPAVVAAPARPPAGSSAAVAPPAASLAPPALATEGLTKASEAKVSEAKASEAKTNEVKGGDTKTAATGDATGSGPSRSDRRSTLSAVEPRLVALAPADSGHGGAPGLASADRATRRTTADGSADLDDAASARGAAGTTRRHARPPAARSSRAAAAAPGSGAPGESPGARAAASAVADPLARGRDAFASGHFPEAVRLGRAAVSRGDEVGGQLLIGDAFYKMDRFAEARAAYAAALQSAPGNTLARRGLDLATRHAQP